MHIAQSVTALDFNFERAVGGSILTADKKLSLENLNVTSYRVSSSSGFFWLFNWLLVSLVTRSDTT